MDGATAIALLGAGGFFLTALLTGVWKFLEMWASDKGLAHPYVDIAHRTALMYAYACLLLAAFAHVSALPPPVEVAATIVPMAFFAAAVGAYILQGARKTTDNQFRPDKGRGDRSRTALYGFMWLLIAGEIGGFAVLFFGVASSPLVGAALSALLEGRMT